MSTELTTAAACTTTTHTHTEATKTVDGDEVDVQMRLAPSPYDLAYARNITLQQAGNMTAPDGSDIDDATIKAMVEDKVKFSSPSSVCPSSSVCPPSSVFSLSFVFSLFSFMLGRNCRLTSFQHVIPHSKPCSRRVLEA